MKNHLLGFVFLSLFLSSCEKGSYEKMTVVRDCTGTYLRHNMTDFRVCNPAVIQYVEAETSIEVNFEKVNSCRTPAEDTVFCDLYHKHDGMVEILNVR